MNVMFLEIETSVVGKLNRSFLAPNQSHCRNEPALELEDECIEEKEKE